MITDAELEDMGLLAYCEPGPCFFPISPISLLEGEILLEENHTCGVGQCSMGMAEIACVVFEKNRACAIHDDDNYRVSMISQSLSKGVAPRDQVLRTDGWSQAH